MFYSHRTLVIVLLIILTLFPCLFSSDTIINAPGEQIVQAQIILTVSESKRIIAKGIAHMPIVQQALQNGMVIIAKGTTNTYVAEEIVGQKIEHGAYLYVSSTCLQGHVHTRRIGTAGKEEETRTTHPPD